MFERFALIRREPLTEVTTFDTEFDRFLDNALDLFELPVYASGPLFAERDIVAPMEVFDRDGHTVVRLEVPGIKMEEIDISVSDGVLTIKGEKKLEEEVKAGDCYCSERTYGSFRRAVSVPKDLDESKISATYDRGVLEVTLPKAEEKPEHKIKIEAKS